jgi:hypothetical protein
LRGVQRYWHIPLAVDGLEGVMDVRRVAWDALAWIFVALATFFAVRALLSGAWHGVPFFLLAGAVCAPPVRRFVNEKIRLKVPGFVYGGLFIGVCSLGIDFAAEQETAQKATAEREAQEAMQKRVAERRDAAEREFRERKLEILDNAQRLFDAGDYAGVRAALGKYFFLKDPDLVRLRDAASLILLRDELKTRPTQERLAFIYGEIARLDPSDKVATSKAAELATQLEQDRERSARRASRSEQIRRQLSSWDGSHRAVEEAIRARMKDPGSYEHVATRILDLGEENFYVFTDFRGRNSFNAVVSSTASATVTPEGTVVSIQINSR